MWLACRSLPHQERPHTLRWRSPACSEVEESGKWKEQMAGWVEVSMNTMRHREPMNEAAAGARTGSLGADSDVNRCTCRDDGSTFRQTVFGAKACVTTLMANDACTQRKSMHLSPLNLTHAVGLCKWFGKV